jgi:hypothetical protein
MSGAWLLSETMLRTLTCIGHSGHATHPHKRRDCYFFLCLAFCGGHPFSRACSMLFCLPPPVAVCCGKAPRGCMQSVRSRFASAKRAQFVLVHASPCHASSTRQQHTPAAHASTLFLVGCEGRTSDWAGGYWQAKVARPLCHGALSGPRAGTWGVFACTLGRAVRRPLGADLEPAGGSWP